MDLIDSEELSDGDALPATSAFAEGFGASRTVIRESLSALPALCIVEVSNGRNVTVRPLNPYAVSFFLSRAIGDRHSESFSALMDLRAPLEVQSAGRAAEQLAAQNAVAQAQGSSTNPPPLSFVLTGLLARMNTFLQDSVVYPKLDLDLHLEIAWLSGNRALHGLLEAVSVPLFRAMRDVRAARDQRGFVGAEHEEHLKIIDSILAGDPAAAASLMERHMSSVEVFAFSR